MTQSGNDLDAQALALFERALKRPKTEREDFVRSKAQDNDALISRTLSLLSLDSKNSEHLVTGHAIFEDQDADISGLEIGDYRIIELIGKGGMGAVYRAERLRGDFTHNVAIKIIRRGAASDALIERFIRERQILADMAHPHIARLLGGGTLADDTPYFIMELIDGAPITDWVATENLNRDERLNLFLQACDAVRYAHQNLIIHRDITPNNVLVTRDGGVKFIDFGIAKPLDDTPKDDTNHTSSVSNSLEGLTLTPGFAAPERSKGASPNTLSDIYSLGMLLRAIMDGASPGQEIDAIITKATEPLPANRYSSVDALIQDINAKLTDRPVAAFAGGAGYHIGKFLKRQKLLSAVSVLAAIAITLGYMGYERAKTAQVFADARFSETREMTTFLLEDLPASLRTIPGTLPVQKKVTEVSAQYLDILAKAAEKDSAVLFDYAMGHAQLGEILTVAGGANIGDPETGLGHFKESLKTLTALEKTNPDNIDLQMALAETEYSYAYAIMYHQGNIKVGIKTLEKALGRFTDLSQKTDGPELRLNFALARLLHLFYGEGDDFYNNRVQADKIRDDYEDLLRTYPDNKDTLPQYASFLRNLAHGPYKNFANGPGTLIPTSQRDNFAQSYADVLRSLELIEELLRDEPTNSSHIYQYVWSIEILVLMELVDKEWETSFENIIGALAQEGAPYSPESLALKLQNYQAVAKDRQRVMQLFERLERGDQMLAQIAPYDANTFTHIEASYYNLKLHSYLHGRFRLDFKKAHEFNDKAKALIEAFKAGDPDFRNAYLEDAITQTEKAYIYSIEQALLGADNQTLICNHLSEASDLWSYSEKRWGEIIDYASDVAFTKKMKDETGCNDE